jgi:hypothetical protein
MGETGRGFGVVIERRVHDEFRRSRRSRGGRWLTLERKGSMPLFTYFEAERAASAILSP